MFPVQHHNPKVSHIYQGQTITQNHHIPRPIQSTSAESIEMPWRLKLHSLQREYVQLRLYFDRGNQYFNKKNQKDEEVTKLKAKIKDIQHTLRLK